MCRLCDRESWIIWIGGTTFSGPGGEEQMTDPELFSVRVGAGDVELAGDLTLPSGATGLVVFAHGSGSSRHSPRNKSVAAYLARSGMATLLFDLLTEAEELVDRRTRHLRFDIPMLADRLVRVTDWLGAQPMTRDLAIGYFGASTGAAAALIAAARRPDKVAAVVSRGGRPDLAAEALPAVHAPTLCIVGSADTEVLDLNTRALARVRTEKRLEIVPGASHLFEEPGTLRQVARLAADWFRAHFPPVLDDAVTGAEVR